MSKKMAYPGSTSKCAPAGVITGIVLCDERSCDRIDVHFDGKRGGSYMVSFTQDVAVDLILKLEAEVWRQASKKGYTCPSLARMLEARRKNVR